MLQLLWARRSLLSFTSSPAVSAVCARTNLLEIQAHKINLPTDDTPDAANFVFEVKEWWLKYQRLESDPPQSKIEVPLISETVWVTRENLSLVLPSICTLWDSLCQQLKLTIMDGNRNTRGKGNHKIRNSRHGKQPENTISRTTPGISRWSRDIEETAKCTRRLHPWIIIIACLIVLASLYRVDVLQFLARIFSNCWW